MKKTQVKRCEAGECAYSAENQCHTLAITVGDGTAHPMYDTICSTSIKGGDSKYLAQIDACMVSEGAFWSVIRRIS